MEEKEKKFLCNDSNGNPINEGDKVIGEGYLTCQDGFKIELYHEVTARQKNGTIYFGALSKSCFGKVFNTAYPYKINRRISF
jgi:hypothetical protein